MGLRGLCNGLERCASGTQHQTMGAAPRSEGGILLHRFFSERPVLVGQRLHLSHDHHLIRSWGIRHEKRFDVDEVLYQDCVTKLLVWYLGCIASSRDMLRAKCCRSVCSRTTSSPASVPKKTTSLPSSSTPASLSSGARGGAGPTRIADPAPEKGQPV